MVTLLLKKVSCPVMKLAQWNSTILLHISPSPSSDVLADIVGLACTPLIIIVSAVTIY